MSSIKNIPANFLTDYKTRIDVIGQQAKGLEKLDKPELYSEFVESSIQDTVAAYGPRTEEHAYAKLVSAVSKDLKDYPKIQQGLWQTALKVVAGGVPGCAGVALAKTLDGLGGDISPSDKGWAALQGLTELRVDHGQTFIGEQIHANVGLNAATNQAIPVEHREIIAANSISTIAAMEDWNIRS